MSINFETDDDSIRLFEIVIHFLKTYFNHSEEDAVALLNTYHREWKHLHKDDDFYHQIGAYETAVRIHYFMNLKGNEDNYIHWRRDNGYNKTPFEALDYFRKHYYDT